MKDCLNSLTLIGLKTSLIYLVFIVIIFSIPIIYEHKEGGLFGSNLREAVIGEVSIKIEIADSKEERILGLSNRKSIPDNYGLFFVFNEDDYHRIWMRDMNFPIDVIWLDKNFNVVYLEENISPNTYPEAFAPDKKSRYILEVPAGFVSENYIRLNDQMTIL